MLALAYKCLTERPFIQAYCFITYYDFNHHCQKKIRLLTLVSIPQLHFFVLRNVKNSPNALIKNLSQQKHELLQIWKTCSNLLSLPIKLIYLLIFMYNLTGKSFCMNKKQTVNGRCSAIRVIEFVFGIKLKALKAPQKLIYGTCP